MLRNLLTIKRVCPVLNHKDRTTKFIHSTCISNDARNIADNVCSGSTSSNKINQPAKKPINPFAREIPAKSIANPTENLSKIEIENKESVLQLSSDKSGIDGNVCSSSTTTNKINEPAKKPINPFAREIPAKSIDNLTENLSKLEIENKEPVPQLSPDEKERRLKVLQLEVDIANQEGRRVPTLEFFKDFHWEHVLTLLSKSARMKYYGFLWQIEMKKESKQRKKEERAEASHERMEKVRQERAENLHINYGLGHVSMFMRIYDSTINHWMNHRLIRAMQFSPKIVLDCSYDSYMTKREAENAAKQLMLCFAENRFHDDPFDLHYCNVDLNTACMKSLQRYIPTMLNPEFPMNVHHKCFTDIFPKENLVYLTPHCRTELVQYNPDDVYIVGAMVDTVNNEPLSLAKAKRLGLRMARLPLDRYLQWSAGSGKSLTLNQMINIMLDLKTTGDWMTSLRHVPRRKVIDAKKEAMDFQNKMDKHSNRLNVRIDRILRNDNVGTHENNRHHQHVRSHKDSLQFNLSTWGSKKKERQGS